MSKSQEQRSNPELYGMSSPILNFELEEEEDNPAAIADDLQELLAEEAVEILKEMPAKLAASVFSNFDDVYQQEILSALDADSLAKIAEATPLEGRAKLLARLRQQA